MLCSKCGKEISDDSVFCYFCGSKIKIEGKQDTVTDAPPVIVNTETNSRLQDSTKEITGVSSMINKAKNTKKQTIINQNNSNQALDNYRKRGYGGLFVLLLFYGYIVSKWMINNNTDFSIAKTTVIILCFPLLIMLYFKSRNILLKRKYFMNKITLSSFICGFLSLIFVMSINGFTTGIVDSSQKSNKLKQINEFANNYKGQIETVQKKEIEYSKILGSEPKTEAELKDMLSKLDEYKEFSKEKNKTFLISLFFLGK